jgi:zinc transport system ATP-binding protein
VIECRDLSFAYEGNVVLDCLNFPIRKGDYLCIVGENGSGKSTLLRGLLGLKQPSGGQIVVDTELMPYEIGYLSQQTAVQKDFPAGVLEVVLSGRLGINGIKPFYTKEDKEAARKTMKQLAIYELAKKCYRELSGGQQQRVLLARALCAVERLKILFLDEPTSGLDPVFRDLLYKKLAHIQEMLGVTIVMVSHDIQSALKYGEQILHLQNKQVFYGTVVEYKMSGLAQGGAVDD